MNIEVSKLNFVKIDGVDLKEYNQFILDCVTTPIKLLSNNLFKEYDRLYLNYKPVKEGEKEKFIWTIEFGKGQVKSIKASVKDEMINPLLQVTDNKQFFIRTYPS